MSQQLELLTESPSQWTPVSSIAPEIQTKEIKPFVALALKELEGNPDSRTSSLMNADKFAAVRQVVRHLARLRSATKEPWNQEDVQTFLESIRFTQECIAEFSTLLCTEKLYDNIPLHVRFKPGLAGISWKIDLSLSQSNLQSKDLNEQQIKEILHRDTHIIIIIKLTDGQIHTYRLHIVKFHELRFTIASALKSMIVMERRKCMKKD